MEWAAVTLPDAWPDRASLRTVGGFVRLLRYLLRLLIGRTVPVVLPEALPGRELLPDYLLQEFHGLPNGYFSRKMARTYEAGFEWMMLGTVRPQRRRMAEALGGCARVLDAGCGGGSLTAALVEAGIPEVRGLDPVPYCLRAAGERLPGVPLDQGLLENLPYPEARFDGVGVCFVLHELPAAVTDRVAGELARVLAPGGLLVITEPSPEQNRRSLWWWLLTGRFRTAYYRWLAWLAFEPYVDEWLARDAVLWLEGAGFEVLQDDIGMPFRMLVARRRSAPAGGPA